MTEQQPAYVYKIYSQSDWEAALATGVFNGAGIDLADGYIHLSTAAQVQDTARLHFSGQTGLVLLEVETAALGDTLRYETSRNGALFPHLYGPLPVASVRRTWRLPDHTADAPYPVIPEL